MYDLTTLTGVLVDVSGSMKSSVGGDSRKEGGEWVRSVFRVIDDLIKHDLSTSNKVFTVACGASCTKEIFDLIGTMRQCQNTSVRHQQVHMTYEQTIYNILQLLEDGGAHSVRKWARLEIIKKTPLSPEMAALILRVLESDRSFLKYVVDDCLPPACKGYQPEMCRESRNRLMRGVGLVIDTAESLVSVFRPGTEEEIREVVEKAKCYLLKDVRVQSSIFSVQDAYNIIHGGDGEKKLTDNRIQELMDTVEPFIFGRTPLFAALEKAKKLFSDAKYKDYKKLLFVLSDGQRTDAHGKRFFKCNEDVTVVSCFITESREVEPKRLYCEVGKGWEKGAKFLFRSSSKIPTQLLPRTIFIKRGWNIDIKNNETTLFLHVNHPDNLRDACDLARDVVCTQEALADILSSVSLDMYINQSNKEFRAQRQEEATCYANASATVLHLSMKRILGREGGYPDFGELRQELIERYGKKGANTPDVLKDVCPKYRLRCQEVDASGAVCAITAKRPVVAIFRLTEAEWEIFSDFYKKEPSGILTRKEIDISKRRFGEHRFGHAVVLTSYNSKCLILMNSSGTKWGDNGFFRVKRANVLGLKFVDVFWEENDLTMNERDYYARHGADVADKLMKTLKSLQVAEYQCPLCHQMSLVTDFSGRLSRAKCPKCQGEFKSDGAGNILALNMYLTSLCR